jgi:hypothetical protein
MMRIPQAFINRIASGWTFAVFGMATLALVFTVNIADYAWTLPGFKHITHGVGILDMEWHYDANAAYRMLTAQGEAGRARYQQMLWTVDVALPMLVSLWLAITVALALRRLGTSDRGRAWLMLIPLAAGLSDYVENSAISILLAHYPERFDNLTSIAGYATTLKHMLYALSLVTALLLWLCVLAGQRGRVVAKLPTQH